MAKQIDMNKVGKNVPPSQFKSIEEMYKFFLKLNNLDESKMDKDEYIERRRTFYAACAVMFDVLILDTPNSQAEVNKLLNGLQAEIAEFWELQKGRLG